MGSSCRWTEGWSIIARRRMWGYEEDLYASSEAKWPGHRRGKRSKNSYSFSNDSECRSNGSWAMSESSLSLVLGAMRFGIYIVLPLVYGTIPMSMSRFIGGHTEQYPNFLRKFHFIMKIMFTRPSGTTYPQVLNLNPTMVVGSYPKGGFKPNRLPTKFPWLITSSSNSFTWKLKKRSDPLWVYYQSVLNASNWVKTPLF